MTTRQPSPPKLVLLLSEVWTMTDPRDLRRVVGYAVEAEAAGFDAVMVGEHVLLGPSSAANGLPSNPRDWIRAGMQEPSYPHPSGLHMLTAMAAATERIRLLAAAVISPLRHALLLAKELATIDLLSEGRLVVMPTVSWQREEYEALGVPFTRRGRILDEQLEIWQRAWTTAPVRYDGEHYRFDDVWVEPKPFRPSGVSMYFGGRSLAPHVVRRVTRFGSGVFTLVPPSADELRGLDEALAAAGRDPGELEIAAIAPGEHTDATSTADLASAVAAVRPLVERGVSTFVFKPSQFIDDGARVGAFCREAVARMSELVATGG